MLQIVNSILLVSSLLPLSASLQTEDTCNPRVVGGDGRIICVCDEKICRDLEFDWPEKPGDAYLVSSSKLGRRFETAKLIQEDDDGAGNEDSDESFLCHRHVKVDLRDEQQTILGWGGAFTDASGINVFSLSKNMSDKLIESYYGKNGLQYNFGRVPIGGCDFSPRNYSYDDTENCKPDYELKHWSLAEEDLKYKIPLIKMAQDLLKAHNSTLKLFGSPWSPPAWMKTSRSLIRGFLVDDERVYESYAKYLTKFFEAYEKEGVEKFWGMTVQNEPVEAMSNTYYFNSLQYDNQRMTKFITQYLGPELNRTGRGRRNHFHLMIGDDNLKALENQVEPLLKLTKVRRFISGMALHWYQNQEVGYERLEKIHESVEDLIDFTLSTEACSGFKPDDKHVDLGSWQRGEDYAQDVIQDLVQAHSSGWIDWNLALDMEGGPNWVNNFVDSPIIVNKKRNEFYKQPMYYALAHFSRFFKPKDSVVLGTKVDGFGTSLQAVSVHNKKTGHIVVNILNKNRHERMIHLRLKGLRCAGKCSQYKPFTVDGNSINTVIIKL